MENNNITEDSLMKHVEAFERQTGVNTAPQADDMTSALEAHGAGGVIERLHQIEMGDDVKRQNEEEFERAVADGRIMNGIEMDERGYIRYKDTMEEGRTIDKITIGNDDTAENPAAQRGRKAKKKKVEEPYVQEVEPMALSVTIDGVPPTYNNGFTNLDIEELPSRGKHYPDGFAIGVRPCTTEELRHWALLPIDSLIERENAINYILENCTHIFSSTDGTQYSFRDLLEADRIYILLAIREETFGASEEPLVMNIEGENHPIVKENLTQFDFLSHPQVAGKKSIKMNQGVINVTIPKKHSSTGEPYDIKLHFPTIGTSMWLQYYFVSNLVDEDGQIDVPADELDFYQCAMVLMHFDKEFSVEDYNKIKQEFLSLKPAEVAIIKAIRDIITEVSKPTISYINSGGVEREAPLSFRDGIKSLFGISNPLGDLE